MGCLYIATGPTGKSYIGITIKDEMRRWAKHCEHAEGKRPGALYAAIRKYGAANFLIRKLVVADDWEYLCDLEQRAIKIFSTLTPSGYNLTEGGEGNRGPRSEDARLRIGTAQRKRFQRPEERAKARAAGMRGIEALAAKRAIFAASPEYAAMKAKRVAEKEAYRATWKVRHSTAVKAALAQPEVKAKVIAEAKKRASDPQWRAKISATKAGRKLGPHSEEWNKNIAAARLREWADPRMRKKRLAALAKARIALATKRKLKIPSL